MTAFRTDIFGNVGGAGTISGTVHRDVPVRQASRALPDALMTNRYAAVPISAPTKKDGNLIGRFMIDLPVQPFIRYLAGG